MKSCTDILISLISIVDNLFYLNNTSRIFYNEQIGKLQIIVKYLTAHS